MPHQIRVYIASLERRHPCFVGVQFHPELKSRPFDPAPGFASFIHVAVEPGMLV